MQIPWPGTSNIGMYKLGVESGKVTCKDLNEQRMRLLKRNRILEIVMITC